MTPHKGGSTAILTDLFLIKLVFQQIMVVQKDKFLVGVRLRYRFPVLYNNTELRPSEKYLRRGIVSYHCTEHTE